MEKIRILTDSGSDIVRPYPENLTVLPLSIRFGDEEFLDGVNIDHRSFYEKLTKSAELPKTSLISPSTFAEAFAKAAQAGETVIAVLLSGKLSGTYQSAVLAAEGFENVHVVDSNNATLGEQILVKYALRLADAGLKASEIVEKLEQDKSHIRLTGVPENLEYLRKGGRISAAVAFVGGAMGIKPVLVLDDGVVIMLGKARGAKNAHNAMIKVINDANGVNFDKPFCLGYTGLSDEPVRRFIEDSANLWEGRLDSIPVSSVGATIGTHVGPGAVVAAFFDNL